MENTIKKDIEIPEEVLLSDLIVSYNELFDDFVIYAPWDNKQYIIRIGDFSLGFGERPFLQSALEKIRKKYGDRINTILIETRRIPKLSEPLHRRHGMKVKVVHVPLSKDLDIYFEQMPPWSANWEDMSGDENVSKNVNEPELWRPLHQRTTKI